MKLVSKDATVSNGDVGSPCGSPLLAFFSDVKGNIFDICISVISTSAADKLSGVIGDSSQSHPPKLLYSASGSKSLYSYHLFRSLSSLISSSNMVGFRTGIIFRNSNFDIHDSGTFSFLRALETPFTSMFEKHLSRSNSNTQSDLVTFSKMADHAVFVPKPVRKPC